MFCADGGNLFFVFSGIHTKKGPSFMDLAEGTKRLD